MSGEVCRGVIASRSPLPVVTLRGYELPLWVGPDTLVFAASYSGNTEETLELFDRACERGARMVVVSSGGALTERARLAGVPIVGVTEGLQPRAALGCLAVPMLEICHRVGVGPAVGEDIAETIGLLECRAAECHRAVPVTTNPAKILALRLIGKLAWIYGAEGLSEVAAYRWKCQLNECAKVLACWNCFPELTHNELVGWDGQATGASAALIVLRHKGEHPRVARRIDSVLPMIEGCFDLLEQVWARGSSALARLLDLCYLGDFTSTYLGLARGVDPGPVEVIECLKQRLAADAHP